MDKNYMIGNFIMELRLEKGMTQKQLANCLNISNRTVSSWENGAALPRLALLEKLAEVLGVTTAEILAGERLQMPTSNEERFALYRQLRERTHARCDCCKHSKPVLYRPNACWVCKKCRAGLQAVPAKRFPYWGLLFLFLLRMIWYFLPRANRYLPDMHGIPTKHSALLGKDLLAISEGKSHWCFAFRQATADYVLQRIFYILAFLALCVCAAYLLVCLHASFSCRLEITSYPDPDWELFVEA